MTEAYYFRQLDKAGQAAYHAMKTGLAALRPAFPVPRLEGRELGDVLARLRLDCPELFYVTGFSYRVHPAAATVELLPQYLFDKGKIQTHQKALAARLAGKEGVVTRLRRTRRQAPPPAAYDLTELQRDANKKYAYSAKETLAILQNLYEIHKVVTYPRTDSRYIPDDVVPTLPERLRRWWRTTSPWRRSCCAAVPSRPNIWSTPPRSPTTTPSSPPRSRWSCGGSPGRSATSMI